MTKGNRHPASTPRRMAGNGRKMVEPGIGSRPIPPATRLPSQGRWQARSDPRPYSFTSGTGSRAGRGGSLLDQLGNHRVELTAGLDRVELTILVDHEHRRDRVDPPGLGKLAVPALAL